MFCSYVGVLEGKDHLSNANADEAPVKLLREIVAQVEGEKTSRGVRLGLLHVFARISGEVTYRYPLI